MRCSMSLICSALLLVCVHPVSAQTAKELAIITADTALHSENQRIGLLMTGTIVVIEHGSDVDDRLWAISERIHLAEPKGRNDELIIGLISRINVMQPEAAVVEFTARLSKTPTDVAALLGRANAQLCLRQVTKAIDDFSSAVALDGKNAVLLVRRAEALRRAGRLQEAVADCSKALDLEPTLVPALVGRARVRGELGQYDHAIQNCTKALAINESAMGALCCRGCLHVLSDNMNKAIADFKTREPLWATFQRRSTTAVAPVDPLTTEDPTRTIEKWLHNWIRIHDVVPGLRESFVLRILCAPQREDRRPLRDELSKALMLRLPPQVELRVLFYLGMVYGECEQHTEAVERLTQAIRLESETPESIRPSVPLPALLTLRGRSLIFLKQIDKATADCSRAIDLDPTFVAAYFLRSACRTIQGDTAGGASDLKRGKELAADAEAGNPLTPVKADGDGKQ